jgi:hypothetical protein
VAPEDPAMDQRPSTRMRPTGGRAEDQAEDQAEDPEADPAEDQAEDPEADPEADQAEGPAEDPEADRAEGRAAGPEDDPEAGAAYRADRACPADASRVGSFRAAYPASPDRLAASALAGRRPCTRRR